MSPGAYEGVTISSDSEVKVFCNSVEMVLQGIGVLKKHTLLDACLEGFTAFPFLLLQLLRII